MDLSTFRSYTPNNVDDKIQYWIDLWEDLIENFNQNLYGLDLINPQLVIKELADEINFNHLRNQENKNYFKNKIGSLINRDPILKENFRSDFSLLLKEFDTESNLYLLQLCKAILDIFRTGIYFEAAYNLLKTRLLDSNWEEKDQEHINILSQHLIVELLLKGYTLDSIKGFPDRLFGIYEEEQGTLSTSYPYSTNWKDFKTATGFDRENFNQAVKAEMDSLSIDQRLQRFSGYYLAQPTEGYFIFQVEGLKGSADFNIGNVNFYSPQNKKYRILQGDFSADGEIFSTTNGQYFINAAVRMSYVDTDAAKMKAVEILDKALDLIRCYLQIETKLEIRSDNYVIAGLNGENLGSGIEKSARHESYRWRKSLDLNKDPIEMRYGGLLKKIFDKTGEFLFLPLESQSELEQKIGYSLHWYRKAEETNNSEDKLLNYWIVIENLLTFKPLQANSILPIKQADTKSLFAKELLSHLQVHQFISDVGLQLYNDLSWLIRHSQLILPSSLIEACNLRIEADIDVELSLEPLVSNLSEILNATDRRIIKQKCIFAQRFYSDNEFAKEELNKQLRQFGDDILLIYRYRNKIVHNAQFDTTILPYFVQKARKFAEQLLERIIYQRSIAQVKTIEEIIVADYTKVKRIMNGLNSRKPIDFLNLGF
jgi:hypothetical protein